MSDENGQTLGRIEGKLDHMIDEFKRYIVAHDDRHNKIEEKLDDHAGTLNQAKGAKTMVLIFAGGISAIVSFLSKRIF